MIYPGLEFIDIKARLVEFQHDSGEKYLSCFDFSESTILNRGAYKKLIANIVFNFHNCQFLHMGLKANLKIFSQRCGFSHNDHLRLIKVVYNNIAKPYYDTFYLLSCLIHNVPLYFLALHIVYYYNIQGYVAENFYNVVKKNYNNKNNNQITIISHDKISKIIEEDYQHSDFRNEVISTCCIIPQFDYFQIEENKLISVVEYLQNYYSEKHLISLIREWQPCLNFIPENDNINLRHFLYSLLVITNWILMNIIVYMIVIIFFFFMDNLFYHNSIKKKI
jgi:hypothetical protein